MKRKQSAFTTYWVGGWKHFVRPGKGGNTPVSTRDSGDSPMNLLPRDALHKRVLCRGKMSVCPTVTCRYCVETVKHIL